MRDPGNVRRRLDDRINAWHVNIERVAEIYTSILAFGRQEDTRVVLKIVKAVGDEWRAGEVLQAFGGLGVVRVYKHEDGATLLERLDPGTALTPLAIGGSDDEAARIVARTIAAMAPVASPVGVPGVSEWGSAFGSYLASGDARIAAALVRDGHATYSELCDSQTRGRLLHGDLHHDNILFDTNRGWVAIDPKGVVGELEYEVGAALRNPHTSPELFTDPATIERRVDCFTRELNLDRSRVLGWAFAQAVLAAIWAIEDGEGDQPRDAWIALAKTIGRLHNKPSARISSS